MKKCIAVVAVCVGMLWTRAVLAADAAKPEASGKAGATATAANYGFFPNDLGSPEIDVSGYPKEMRQSYKVFAFKCAACHTIARPINSQFLELTEDEIKKAKTDDPELFKDDKIIHPEPMVWNRYVKRMMSKPGCPVGAAGKQIYEFLVFDSKTRKTGDNGKAFRENRAHLLKDFKEKYPDAYKSVFPDQSK
jgi:hypothetical protein